jgi:hypothetical protein
VAGLGGEQQLHAQVQEEERRRRTVEAELAAERRLRQQAQYDFQELLQSVDMLHSPPSRSPDSSLGSLQLPPPRTAGSAGISPADASQQPSQPPEQQKQQQKQLQAAFSALQSVAHRLSSISGGGNSAGLAPLLELPLH